MLHLISMLLPKCAKLNNFEWRMHNIGMAVKCVKMTFNIALINTEIKWTQRKTAVAILVSHVYCLEIHVQVLFII